MAKKAPGMALPTPPATHEAAPAPRKAAVEAGPNSCPRPQRAGDGATSAGSGLSSAADDARNDGVRTLLP
jgi:hypothetical protein